MLGAIAGDMIGSVYEFDNRRSKDFPLFTEATTFTDDTILSVAVADVLLHGGDYAKAFKNYYWRYPTIALLWLIVSRAMGLSGMNGPPM